MNYITVFDGSSVFPFGRVDIPLSVKTTIKISNLIGRTSSRHWLAVNYNIICHINNSSSTSGNN